MVSIGPHHHAVTELFEQQTDLEEFHRNWQKSNFHFHLHTSSVQIDVRNGVMSHVPRTLLNQQYIFANVNTFRKRCPNIYLHN